MTYSPAERVHVPMLFITYLGGNQVSQFIGIFYIFKKKSKNLATWLACSFNKKFIIIWPVYIDFLKKNL